MGPISISLMFSRMERSPDDAKQLFLTVLVGINAGLFSQHMCVHPVCVSKYSQNLEN